MRVNPDPYPDLLAAVAQTQQQIQTDEQEIASGQSVNLPSDDPAAAALLAQNAGQTRAGRPVSAQALAACRAKSRMRIRP